MKIVLKYYFSRTEYYIFFFQYFNYIFMSFVMNFDKFFTFVFQLIYFYDIYPGFKVQSSDGQKVVTSSVECGTHAATLLQCKLIPQIVRYARSYAATRKLTTPVEQYRLIPQMTRKVASSVEQCKLIPQMTKKVASSDE